MPTFTLFPILNKILISPELLHEAIRHLVMSTPNSKQSAEYRFLIRRLLDVYQQETGEQHSCSCMVDGVRKCQAPYFKIEG